MKPTRTAAALALVALAVGSGATAATTSAPGTPAPSRSGRPSPRPPLPFTLKLPARPQAGRGCRVHFFREGLRSPLLAVQTCLVSRLNVARMPELGRERVGTVRFGTSKAQAVVELKQRLGKPSGRFPDTGCLPRYSEVAWRDLVVEFRDGRLSGFRYLVGGWPPMNRPANHSLRTPVTPLLRTTAGITLGDTLKRVRRQEGGLQRVGADSWRAPDGLVFVDNAKHDPVPPSAHIIEIKFGTCGDI